MQIRLLTDRVGGNGFMQRDGDIVDVPEREAFRMIQSGQAESVEMECAAIGAAENATLTHARPKRK